VLDLVEDIAGLVFFQILEGGDALVGDGGLVRALVCSSCAGFGTEESWAYALRRHDGW
jgi:hypothetical protein